MNPKPSAKARNPSRKQFLKKDTEIANVDGAAKYKQIKETQKKKDSTDNTSSEPTLITLNKGKNKKEKEVKSIDVMDVEIPEAIPKTETKIQKKENVRKTRNNRSKDIINVKRKRRDKLDTFISGNLRSRKIESITLDESDSGEVQITNEEKSPKYKRKSPAAKNKGKQQKKDEKKKKVKQNAQSLLTEEKKIKKDISVSKIEKKNIDLSNNEFHSITKISEKNKENENDDLKSRSVIKSTKKPINKEDNFLGKKRRARNKSNIPLSPEKKKEKASNQKDKLKNKKDPAQNVNLSSVTNVNGPKNNSKKKNNLRIPKMEEENSKKKIVSPGLTVLNQLFNEFGFEKVIDTLCKTKLEEKYKLDSCLKGLKGSICKEKLSFLLIKILYTYFGSQIEEIKKEFLKRSTSARKTATAVINIEENGSKRSKNSGPKTPEKKKKSINSFDGVKVEYHSTIVDEGDEHFSKKKIISNTNEAPKEKTKSNSQKKEKKNEKLAEETTIGSHFNKAENGDIYKYQVNELDKDGNALFKCYDEKCIGEGIFYVEKKMFSVTKAHNIPYAEHDYVVSLDKDEYENIIKKLKESDRTDAQVYKEKGKRMVKLY